MRYLIFGGTGSLGKKLIERLLPTDSVAVYSRDEAKHWTLKNELAGSKLSYRLDALKFFVGDVRDVNRIRDVLRQYNPDNVIVAAALKQVDTCELSPTESIMTNLLGTQNVMNVANEGVANALQRVLFVSTDKACSPVNVYGMCKAISERVVSSQALTSTNGIKFLCVRYGNVLESRGSIIPLFKHQAENSDHLTVTDPEMTRFVMTLDNSVDLIQMALRHGKSGDTWIPKIPAMKIGDLAELFSELYKKPIKLIGLRPGEKLHEDLINESESVRTKASDDKNHYIIGPASGDQTGQRFTYSSNDTVMSKTELHDHLTKLEIFDAPLSSFKGLAIEEIITNRK
jgi:UDP-N-acetylglucosamine 4,6-dehydratase